MIKLNVLTPQIVNQDGVYYPKIWDDYPLSSGKDMSSAESPVNPNVIVFEVTTDEATADLIENDNKYYVISSEVV